MEARTGWPAKMCSGNCRRMATPESVIEERIPDMRMIAMTLTGRGSQRNGNGLDDFAQDGFRGFGFFLQRGVPRTGHDAVGKNRYSELLEVVRETEIAAIEESAGLRGALQHQSAARADAE